MTVKTPAQLKADIIVDFPDNTTGFITPAIMRTFQDDIVDSYSGGNLSSAVATSTGSTTARSLATHFADTITPEDFGAVGDGNADDTTAFGLFLDAANNKNCLLEGVYKLTSLIAKPLTNCRLMGIPGHTKITGSFDYTTLQFLALNNVTFENIIFESTYTNVADTTGGVVRMYQTDIKNVAFKRCEFTCPNARGQGLVAAARINAADTSAVIDGLWIEDCNFHDIGELGCLIMNRGVNDANKFTKAQRIFFNRNKCSAIGTFDATDSILVSFDGVGSTITVDNNLIAGCLLAGIENTGFINGSISRNSSFDGSPLISINGADTTNKVMTGLTIIGNVMHAPTTHNSAIYYVANSLFANNQFLSSSTTSVIELRGVSNCVFINEIYINSNASGLYALLVDSGTGNDVNCFNNTWFGCTFDNSASGTNNATVRFQDTGNTNNIIKTPSIINKGTGGSSFDQISGATGNSVEVINAGASLGSAAVAWANLFLASGGVINWNNGDVTITHSSNALAFAGASTGYTFDAEVSSNTRINATLATGLTPFSATVGAGGQWQIGQNTGATSGDDTYGFYSVTYGTGHSSRPILQLNSSDGSARFDGAVKSVSPSGGIGYLTGAGNVVTQTGSRTTAVAINAVSGQITMFSAAGSATAATFTVDNTSVAATDTIILNQQSGTNLYNFIVTAVAGNSFNITFFTTGGTATDAPVINFNVIKGVAA